MNRTLALVGLGALLLAHIGLASLFLQRTPYRSPGMLLHQGRAVVPDIGAPDERQHVNYIVRLQRGEGFPVLRPGSSDLYETYQAHQPPLYYIVASGWASMLGADADDPGSGGKLRALNVAIGALTVAGVYFLALWSLGRNGVALFASSLAALLPMHIALSAAVSNDPLLFALCTWALAGMARAIRSGWTWVSAITVGVLCGLALLTKTTAIALLPAMAAAWYVTPRAEGGRRIWAPLIAASILALAIPMAWWMRNHALYGDPLAMRAFTQAFSGSPQAADFIAQLGAWTYWIQWVGWWTLRSWIGAFGYMDIFFPPAVYGIALAGFALYWTIGGLSLNRIFPEERRALVPSWIFLAIVAALFLRFNAQYFQGQARYLYPAVGPIAILAAIAPWRIAPARPWLAALPFVLFLGGLSLYAAERLPEDFRARTVLYRNGTFGLERGAEARSEPYGIRKLYSPTF